MRGLLRAIALQRRRESHQPLCGLFLVQMPDQSKEFVDFRRFFETSPPKSRSTVVNPRTRKNDSSFRADLEQSTSNERAFIKFFSLGTEHNHRRGKFDKPSHATLESPEANCHVSPNRHLHRTSATDSRRPADPTSRMGRVRWRVPKV